MRLRSHAVTGIHVPLPQHTLLELAAGVAAGVPGEEGPQEPQAGEPQSLHDGVGKSILVLLQEPSGPVLYLVGCEGRR